MGEQRQNLLNRLVSSGDVIDTGAIPPGALDAEKAGLVTCWSLVGGGTSVRITDAGRAALAAT